MAEKERLFSINSVKRDKLRHVFCRCCEPPALGLCWSGQQWHHERSVPQRDSGHQGVALCHLPNSASADLQSGTRG